MLKVELEKKKNRKVLFVVNKFSYFIKFVFKSKNLNNKSLFFFSIIQLLKKLKLAFNLYYKNRKNLFFRYKKKNLILKRFVFSEKNEKFKYYFLKIMSNLKEKNFYFITKMRGNLFFKFVLLIFFSKLFSEKKMKILYNTVKMQISKKYR